MPIRAEPSAIPRELVLPESVERELRTLLTQEDGGVLTTDAIRRFADLRTAQASLGASDSNDDRIARFGECEIVADGGRLLGVILEGLLRRLKNRIDRDERLRFSGER